MNILYAPVTLQVLAPFSVSRGVFLCSRRDSNPYLLFRGKILSLLCMPVPPLERDLFVVCCLSRDNQYSYPPTLKLLVGVEGLEPSTYGLKVRYSAS